ncbi:MAG: DUF6242 domain-containing protein [Bacteroides sp.]
MNIKFLSVIVSSLIVSLTFTSCLDNETTLEYGTDATVTSFSLTNVVTFTDAKTVLGKDTVLLDTINVSNTATNPNRRPFTIDQISGRIFNPDSLPKGTNLKKQLINLSIGGSAVEVKYEKRINNLADTTFYWASTDSLDFTNKVSFIVHAADYNVTKTYQVDMFVHKQDPNLLVWNEVKNHNLPVITGKQKAITLAENIYVFAQEGNNVSVYVTGIKDGKTWKKSSTITKADCSSAITFKNKLFIVSDGNVSASVDGIAWTVGNATSAGITNMIAAFDNAPVNTRLYKEDVKLTGIRGEKFVQTSDGEKWEEGNNTPSDFLKTISTSTAAYVSKSNPDIEKIVIAGIINETDTAAAVWGTYSNSTTWAKYSPEDENIFDCPNLKNLTIIRYNNQLLAFGGEGISNGKVITPFQAFYSSLDDGKTWKEVKKNLSFPKEFTNGGAYSCVVDKDNFIWIVRSNNGGIWKGRINRLGFIKQ